MHCGKLINQAEALQKDLSKREVIVQSPEVDFFFGGGKPVRCILKLEDNVIYCKPSNISWIILNSIYGLFDVFKTLQHLMLLRLEILLINCFPTPRPSAALFSP